MSNRYARIRAELTHAESADPPTALEHLRIAIEELTDLLDEQLARAVVDNEMSLRAAGARAGLSENAVGPRLARTSMFVKWKPEGGRVTAKDIQLARYDKKGAAPAAPADSSTTSKPLRFKPRRNG